MTNTLPASALLSGWAAAWLRGEVALDDLAGRVGPGHQVVVGLPGAAGPEPLMLALGELRRRGTTEVTLALPVPGDPVGLAGPPAFNSTALTAGEAVLLAGSGLGLVPVVVGGATEWRCAPAEPAPWIDLAECSTILRQTLLEVTGRLVDLDVASWQPAIPDALMNLRHRTAPPLPPSYDARRVDTVDRALLCREVVALAAETDDGALSAHQMTARRQALDELDRAARRALVAACR